MEDRSRFEAARVAVSQVQWADAAVEQVVMTYDNALVVVREGTGQLITVTAHGAIGLQVEGFWDETLIRSAEVIQDHPFGRQNWDSVRARLGEGPTPTGSADRNTEAFSTLVVTLDDGSTIRVVGARFTTERMPSSV